MFIVINVAEHAQVLRLLGVGLGRLIGLGQNIGPIMLMWSTAALSSITANIPLAAVLAKTVQALPQPVGPDAPIW